MSKHDSWETVHILFARADGKTGAITCQLGDVLSGEVMEEDAPMYTGIGLICMPAPPVPGVSAAEAVTFKSGNTDYVVGGRSVRSAAIAGLIRMGESCIYADGSQACMLLKLDGSITRFTTQDNTANGQAIFDTLGVTGHEVITPWTRYNNNATGFHLFLNSGARLDLGTIAGLPSPLDTFGTYFSVEAHMMRLNTGFLCVGPDIGAPDPVVKATELSVILTTIATALQAINTAMATITTATPGATAAAAAQTAVSAATTAIGTALVTMSSASLAVQG